MLAVEAQRHRSVPPRRARPDVTSGGGDGGVPYGRPGAYGPVSCLVGLESTRPGAGGVGAGRTGPGEKIGKCGAGDEGLRAAVGADGV